MATAVSAKPQAPETEEQLAARYAGGIIYNALIQAGEPLKASEVTKLVARPDVELRLTRVILTTHPGITATERKWTLWSRYLDNRNTVDRNLTQVLNAFGQPMAQSDLAHELSFIYNRPAEAYETMLDSLVAPGDRYARIASDYVVPGQWLLKLDPLVTEDRILFGRITEDPVRYDAEVMFDNFLEDDDVMPYYDLAEKLDLREDNIDAVRAILDEVDRPLKGLAIQFLAWRRHRRHFDRVAFYEALYTRSGTTLLNDGTWIGPKTLDRLLTYLPVLAQQEVSDNAEAEAQQAAQPLVVGDEDREQLVISVLESEGTMHAAKLLEDLFEVTEEDRTYDVDRKSVIDALRADERILWVGMDRFRANGTIPAFVFSVPGLLEFGDRSYIDMEGNPVDLLLEDGGFDGGLEREVLTPLAQDVLDEEPLPIAEPNPPVNARAVIKYHHKQIGTMPLCQFAPGFFPLEPSILETEFLLPGGQRAQVWVNNETRMMYGLLDWFQSIPIDSGATFTLERQTPDQYLVNYNEESEPAMFVSRNRVNELMDLQTLAEQEGYSHFEVIRQIMEHYRKGIEFITLLTEVNIVRRVRRRMVASILSEYHCFFQRGGAWVYDAKKLTQGFDKSKRKYLMK